MEQKGKGLEAVQEMLGLCDQKWDHQDSKKGGLEDVIQIEEANKPTKRHLQRASTCSLAIPVVLECNDLKHFRLVDS